MNSVDCVLLFLAAETNEDRRQAQQVRINMLDLRDTLDKLEQRAWKETMNQPQSAWMDDPEYKIRIRHDTLLLLDDIERIDREIDERVLDLYNIADPVDRQRVLNSVGSEADDML